MFLRINTVVTNRYSDGFSPKHYNPVLKQPSPDQSFVGSSGRVFHFIGNIHDIETDGTAANSLSIASKIFSSHWGHLGVIFCWLSGTLFHIAWHGNFSAWLYNPFSAVPVGHGIWDPHFSSYLLEAYSVENAAFAAVSTTTGVYNLLLTIGVRNDYDIYLIVLLLQIGALWSIILGSIHLIYLEQGLQYGYSSTSKISTNHPSSYDYLLQPYRAILGVFDTTGIRLNYHIGVLFGLFCLLWCGHLVHVSLPEARGVDINFANVSQHLPIEGGLSHIFCLDWSYLARGTSTQAVYSVFGSPYNSGSGILSFIGGTSESTGSLYITDIAHHHLALGVILIWAGNFYRTIFLGIGHRLADIVKSNASTSQEVYGAVGTVQFLCFSLHLQLSLALICLGVITSVVAQHMYSMTPFVALSWDYAAVACIYVHHQYIASILMVGGCAHGALFLVRDYSRGHGHNTDLLASILSHKSAIISHLSWVCLFLGFHTLLLYIHNDTVNAFGCPDKSICIEPVFAQSIQTASGKQIYGIGVAAQSASTGWVAALNSTSTKYSEALFNSIILPIGPGDLLAHHAIALGLHVTSLILIKGALDSRGSKLMPDKVHYGYAFACDGPGRGGTCDISSWDCFYLALFWMLNTDAWLMFYFHWKHLSIWENSVSVFEESSVYLNGWFRDYLWFHSGNLIRGYDSLGVNDLSDWNWLFLAAHLCWAVGFMFLISWRGFWQELIDVIIFMHLRTPFVYDLWSVSCVSPVALSIVQARFVGLFHFAVGFIATYAAFVLGSTT